MAQVHVSHGEVVHYDRLASLDNGMRNRMLELDSVKNELLRVQAQIKSTEKKLEDGEQEKKTLHTKVSSLKVKLGVSNANLNASKDEMESVRTSLSEAQIQVARLEERLSAANSELDRLRDPANPDSNMGLKKHVATDRRDIKRTKLEIGVEQTALAADQESVKKKDFEIKEMEKYLARFKDELHKCETKRAEAQDNEEMERQRKQDLVKEYNHIRKERKQYDTRIKHAKIKLGVSVAGQNVNAKLMEDMQTREQQLVRRLNTIEKKFKETSGELDVLKSKDKMTKTALSINDHTTRFTRKRDFRERQLSVAQSGIGPVRFGDKMPKALQSDPKVSKAVDKLDSRRPKQQDGAKQKANASQTKNPNITVQKVKVVDDPVKGTKPKAKGEKAVQFIPPPKPKLKQTQ